MKAIKKICFHALFCKSLDRTFLIANPRGNLVILGGLVIYSNLQVTKFPRRISNQRGSV